LYQLLRQCRFGFCSIGAQREQGQYGDSNGVMMGKVGAGECEQTDESTNITDEQVIKPAFATVDDPERLIPAIEFRNVQFSFEDQKVLDGISFRVMRGEMKIILGGSGSGKSTILSLALGLREPDEGQILINGEDITGLSEDGLNRVRAQMGIDFQEGALFDSLSVYDNVAFRLHERGVPEDDVEREVRRLLCFVDLEDAIEKMPAELSGGMRTRVGIARALAGDPNILLFDEPTAGLDPPTARDILELAIKLGDLKDVASIFITHEIDNVKFLSTTYTATTESGTILFVPTKDDLCRVNTNILMIRKGRFIFSGRINDLYETEDPYIKNFVGEV
jgi:phospholipid/cholesterol/gamma-HCH transport system ATP-binding protein